MNTRWLIKNWFRVGHKISWKLSFETLAALLYFVPAFQNDFIYRIVEKKHKFVLSYLENQYSDLLDKYRDLPITESVPAEHYIWVMWWQGEDNAPDLVRMCIESIRRNANGAKVIVITENNFRKYADIPEYIIEKHKKGYVSFAQLSDIMRIFLISRHGGLWLDSTIYVSQPIPENIFSKPLYSLHTEYKKTGFVQNDRIHCFVLGGTPGSKPIMFEREFLSAYWKDHDVIVDYYLLDYSIMLQYFNLPDIKSLIDNLEYTSNGLYELVSILDKPYDREKLEKVLTENIFSKLVWNKNHMNNSSHYCIYAFHSIQVLRIYSQQESCLISLCHMAYQELRQVHKAHCLYIQDYQSEILYQAN